MHSTIGIDIAASPELVYRLARDVTRWERLLPHYSARAVRHRRRRGSSCATSSRAGRSCPCSGSASRSPGEPDLARPGDPPAALRPRRGRDHEGMDVTWTIEPRGRDGRRAAWRSSTSSRPGAPGLRARSWTPRSRARSRDARWPRSGRSRRRRARGGPIRPAGEHLTRHARPPSGLDHRHRRRPPSGSGCRAFRAGLRAATRPVKRIDRFDPSPFRSQVAAQVDDFEPLDFMDARAARADGPVQPVRARGGADGDGRRRPRPGRRRARPTRRADRDLPRVGASAGSRSRRRSTRSTSSAACAPSLPRSPSRCSAGRPRRTSASRSTSAARSCPRPTPARAAPSRSARPPRRSGVGEIDAAIAGGVRGPAVAARVRRVRPHPRPRPWLQRRPGPRLAADGRAPGTGSSWARAGRCS